MIFIWSVWQLKKEPLAPLLVHVVCSSCVCRYTTLGRGVSGHATYLASEAILKQKLPQKPQQLHECTVCNDFADYVYQNSDYRQLGRCCAHGH